MEHYKNFQLSIFLASRDIEYLAANPPILEKQYTFFRKHFKFDKIYLELYRSETVDLNAYLSVKKFFEQKGIKLSAAFTAYSQTDENWEHRVAECLCYTDPAALSRTKSLFETMATHFDEILLDDYVFTNCTCQRCRELKGNRAWDDFRLELVPQVCQEYMIEPAKKINPNVKITLKYPTWHESYHRLGYNTTQSPFLFDEIYSGTETRNHLYSNFRNPRYTSYSLMQYLSSISPYRNRGNWFDTYGSVDVIDMLEQLYLSLFSSPKELTLYGWGTLYHTVYAAAMGFELERIDNFLGELGNAIGIPVYLPHNSSGEDHLYDFWGMCGLPFQPTVEFTENKRTILLTSASACDPQLIEKMAKHLIDGGNVILTPGCLEALKGKGIEEFTGMSMAPRAQLSNQFGIYGSADFETNYFSCEKPVSMRIVDFKLNEENLLAIQNQPSSPNPLLSYCNYGQGRLYLLNSPETWSDCYLLPIPILNTLRRELSKDLPIYLEGPGNVSLFPKDNHSCILQSYLPYNTTVQLHIKGNYKEIINLESKKRIPSDYQLHGESIFTLPLQKSTFSAYRW